MCTLRHAEDAGYGSGRLFTVASTKHLLFLAGIKELRWHCASCWTGASVPFQCATNMLIPINPKVANRVGPIDDFSCPTLQTHLAMSSRSWSTPRARILELCRMPLEPLSFLAGADRAVDFGPAPLSDPGPRPGCGS